MILKIFTVFDSKAEAYLPPFFLGSTGLAIRSFTDTVNGTDNNIAQHPEDYTLFELGEYDDANAIINQYSTPKSLGVAIEFKTQQELPLTQPLKGVI